MDAAPSDEISVVLVDQPLARDRRAQRAVSELPGRVVVLDISQERTSGFLRAKHQLRAVWQLVRGATTLRHRAKLTRHLQPLHGNPGAGLAACYRHTFMALDGAHALAELSKRSRLGVVYANDLTAALSALWGVAGSSAARFVYDAHELELHRNRRIGWCRLLVEHTQEQQVMQAAHEVRTVCRPIHELMSAIYSPPTAAFRVVNNDFFQHHQIATPGPDREPAIAYVGTGDRGRRLAALEDLRRAAQFQVHAWLLSEAATRSLGGGHWQHGCDDYESELLGVVQLRRCLMWCCVDVRPLSYRLALPNKFFQALAVCMPIIASRGTYLAELVERFQIGVVLESVTPRQLRDRVQSGLYEAWTSNVVKLRSRLRSGELSL